MTCSTSFFFTKVASPLHFVLYTCVLGSSSGRGFAHNRIGLCSTKVLETNLIRLPKPGPFHGRVFGMCEGLSLRCYRLLSGVRAVHRHWHSDSQHIPDNAGAVKPSRPEKVEGFLTARPQNKTLKAILGCCPSLHRRVAPMQEASSATGTVDSLGNCHCPHSASGHVNRGIDIIKVGFWDASYFPCLVL